MVRSVIEVIDKNADQMFLPANVPSVKSYLYRNQNALKFEAAIVGLGEYVRAYNGGKVPTRLDCIDKVGGVEVIVNREFEAEEHRLQPKQSNINQPRVSSTDNRSFEKSNSLSSGS